MALYGQAKELLTSICEGETKHVEVSEQIYNLCLAINLYMKPCAIDTSPPLGLSAWCTFMQQLLKRVSLPDNVEDLKRRLRAFGLDYDHFVALDIAVGVDEKLLVLQTMNYTAAQSLFLGNNPKIRRRPIENVVDKRSRVTPNYLGARPLASLIPLQDTPTQAQWLVQQPFTPVQTPSSSTPVQKHPYPPFPPPSTTIIGKIIRNKQKQ